MSKFEEKMERANQKARDQARNLLLYPDGNPSEEGSKQELPVQPPAQTPTQDPPKANAPLTDPPTTNPKPTEEQTASTNTGSTKPPKKIKEQPSEQQYAYRPKVHKREKIHDTHTSQAYMIENELIAIINDIVGDTWGGKYRFVNESIKLMIYQEFPEYIDRIRVKE